jgi:hypothetical protein
MRILLAEMENDTVEFRLSKRTAMSPGVPDWDHGAERFTVMLFPCHKSFTSLDALFLLVAYFGCLDLEAGAVVVLVQTACRRLFTGAVFLLVSLLDWIGEILPAQRPSASMEVNISRDRPVPFPRSPRYSAGTRSTGHGPTTTALRLFQWVIGPRLPRVVDPAMHGADHEVVAPVGRARAIRTSHAVIAARTTINGGLGDGDSMKNTALRRAVLGKFRDLCDRAWSLTHWPRKESGYCTKEAFHARFPWNGQQACNESSATNMPDVSRITIAAGHTGGRDWRIVWHRCYVPA